MHISKRQPSFQLRYTLKVMFCEYLSHLASVARSCLVYSSELLERMFCVYLSHLAPKDCLVYTSNRCCLLFCLTASLEWLGCLLRRVQGRSASPVPQCARCFRFDLFQCFVCRYSFPCSSLPWQLGGRQTTCFIHIVRVSPSQTLLPLPLTGRGCCVAATVPILRL